MLWDQDGGNPTVDTNPRDILFTLDARSAVVDCSAAPRQLVATSMRFASVAWGGPDLAVVTECCWKHRRCVVSMMAPDCPHPKLEVGARA